MNWKKFRQAKKQQQTKEFIEKLRAMPNFLSVVETVNEETKKFLEDIGEQDKEKSTYLKEGLIFIKKNGKIVEVRTLLEHAEKLAKEVKGE